MTLSAQVSYSIVAHESSSGDISTQMRVTPASHFVSLSTGTGSNQAQIAWSASRTIDESEVDDFVLTALSDDRGTISFSSIKVWIVKNTSQYDISLSREQSGDASPGLPWPSFPCGGVGGTGFSIGPLAAMSVCDSSATGMVVYAGNVARVSGPHGATYEIVFIGEGTIS